MFHLSKTISRNATSSASVPKHWRKALAALVTGAVLGSGASVVQAAPITFAGLPVANFTPVNPVVGGLKFSNPQQYILSAAYGPTGNTSHLLGDFMTNAQGDNRFLTITSASGSPFSLYSFTAAQVNCCSEDSAMLVTAHFLSGASASLTVSGFSKTAFKTEVLDWFDLTSVEMRSTIAVGGYMAFQSFDTTNPANLPEPAGAVLTLSALGLLGLTRRRASFR